MTEPERISYLEATQKGQSETLERHTAHIGNLLKFQNTTEGAMDAIKWVLGFVGLSNLALLAISVFKFLHN